MKEQALALVRGVDDPARGLNLLREYLQALVLRSFHEAEAFRSMAFVGGTALRFLHGLPRFSEDLDFSLEAPEHYYDGKAWMARVKRDLALAGFAAEVTWNDRKTVHTGWIRIAGLLHEAGLAGPPNQKLAIKVEIDTRPPAGATSERRIVTRHATFLLRFHDLPSLFAGKLHALLTRPYTKGRDWYDFAWYRSQRPPIEPNVAMLQNALDQTQGAATFDAAAWGDTVRKRVVAQDTEAVVRDVEPFLEYPADRALLTRENLLALLP